MERKNFSSVHINRGKVVVALLILLTGISFTGCKKFIDLDAPKTSVNASIVFNDNATAAAVLTGIYARLSAAFTSDALANLSVRGDLLADNLTLFDLNNTSYIGYYTNSLNPTVSSDVMYWKVIYQMMYICNSALEGLGNSIKVDPAVKQQLIGEAHFMRSFLYFYAVNLYGEVPLVLTTNYKINANLSKSKVTEVYAQIVADLTKAQQMLSADYLGGNMTVNTTERSRPNSAVATALLARVYLYLKDFDNAETEASKLIGNTNYQLLPLNSVFLKNSKETIWSLIPVVTGGNTGEGPLFTLPATGPSSARPLYLSINFMSAFETGDQRRTQWTGNVTAGGNTYNYAVKYKISVSNQPVTEHTMVMRLAEQYLIRAEARANRANLSGAIADLDEVRNRAGLAKIANTNPNILKPDLLSQIYRDRRMELFTEWGHRWLDLKRWELANAVLAPIKGSNWQSTDVLLPFGSLELQLAKNLGQNLGYPN